jgi:hypothetical protein
MSTLVLLCTKLQLSKIGDKVNSIAWVVQALSKSKTEFLQAIEREVPNLHLTAMLQYYFLARDSVACQAVEDAAVAAIETGLPQVESSKDKAIEVFWYIVSLIQSGNLKRAEQFIKNFKPEDKELLLSLHLACFLIANLKITPEEERKIAERICDYIQPKIGYLREMVLKEMKSMLLEVRGGKITPISATEQIETESGSLAENKQTITRVCSRGKHA